MGKNSFVLCNDFEEIISELTDEQAGRLIKLIFAYERGGNPETPGDIRLAFIPIRQWLDRNRDTYERISAVRAEAGAKGGKASKPKQNKQLLNKESKTSNCNDLDLDLDLDLELEPVLDIGAGAPIIQPAPSPLYDNKLKEINDEVEKRTKRVLTPSVIDEIGSYMDDGLCKEAFLYAADETGTAGGNYQYFKAILKNLFEAGVRNDIQLAEYRGRRTAEKKAFKPAAQQAARPTNPYMEILRKEHSHGT